MCLSGINEWDDQQEDVQKIHLNLPPGGLALVPKKDRPRYRQALILAAGKTYDDLAAVADKSPVYIGYIINDQRTGYTVRPMIAKFLGFSVADLWPDTPTKYLEAA
ncbi:MAG: hypothetical protein ACOYL3_16305 [Desulfuromonadaceae bacterium]